ncbi:peptidoglycan-binding protein [Streptomyces sp. NPDC001262]|uniref:peptidoglycan-binding domain-containing protein n=1 Tax=Streptomyces TaxID=1883 RepID=UPI0036C784F5
MKTTIAKPTFSRTRRTTALTGLLGAALAVTTAVAVPAAAAPAHEQPAQRAGYIGCLYYDGNDVVSRGDQGKKVQEVQCLLVYWGYDIEVDGDFGPATERAVRGFQGRHHLHVDGIVGPRTWRALHNE